MQSFIKTFVFKSLLEKAIQAEERAYRYYEQMEEAEQLRECKVLLGKLKGAELGHRLRLEEVQRSLDLGVIEAISSSAAADLTALDDSLPEPGVKDRAAEILSHALEKEKKAGAFYRRLLEGTDNTTAGRVFEILAREELKHQEWIRQALEDYRT